MRATRTLLLLGVMALVLAALPQGAAAKPGYIRLPGTFSFSMDLGRVDGYRLNVVGGRRKAFVTARRGETDATYSARGFANRRRLEVDLGRFGRIAVRLERAPRISHQRFFGERCKGPLPRQLDGVASGRIRFHGLGGFVSIDKRRAKAEVVRSFEMVCKRDSSTAYAVVVGLAGKRRFPRPPQGLTLRFDTLAAESRVGGESIQLTASNMLLPGVPATGMISAFTSQRLDGVEIWNSANTMRAAENLSITHRGVHPAAAKVRGSGPFSGTSTYRQLPGGRSEWDGTLAVELPGEGTVPLSGPGFQAKVCHGPYPRAFDECQSSGSHSQSLFDARLSWSR